MNEAINAVPAAPDTGYFPNVEQQQAVARTAQLAREAVLAAQLGGAKPVCVGPAVPGRVDACLASGAHALWNAASALNLAGLGQSALYRDVEAAARSVEVLQGRIAVQLYV